MFEYVKAYDVDVQEVQMEVYANHCLFMDVSIEFHRSYGSKFSRKGMHMWWYLLIYS